MDPLGKKELISFYDRHLKDFGDSPQSVRWTPSGQMRRYETLLHIAGDLNAKRILDFGCGKGDFLGFLKEKGISVEYMGVDINANLITLAQKKFPEADFVSMDIDETDIAHRFDVIFACGVFNLRIAGIEESMKNAACRLFDMCSEALHLNLLTHYVPMRSVELFYVKPEEILQFAIDRLSRTVTLRNQAEDIYLSVFRQ